MMKRGRPKGSKKPFEPRKDRWDIYNNLPHGALTWIAKKHNTFPATVSRVLEGKQHDEWDLIKDAELMAAVNIWRTRFCKRKSQLPKNTTNIK